MRSELPEDVTSLVKPAAVGERSIVAYTQILYEVAGPVATITLNRPKAFNAILPQLELELHQALDEADADRKVRAIILTGSGTAFCAGYDMATGDESNTRPADPSGKARTKAVLEFSCLTGCRFPAFPTSATRLLPPRQRSNAQTSAEDRFITPRYRQHQGLIGLPIRAKHVA
jgi:hypothetical protein